MGLERRILCWKWGIVRKIVCLKVKLKRCWEKKNNLLELIYGERGLGYLECLLGLKMGNWF